MDTMVQWDATVQNHDQDFQLLLEKTVSDYVFEVLTAGNSAWITTQWPNGSKVAFKAAIDDSDSLKLGDFTANGNVVQFELSTGTGKYEIRLQFGDADQMIFHYRTTFTPNVPVKAPDGLNEIVALTHQNAIRKIDLDQSGKKSRILFAGVSDSKSESVFYIQNGTEISKYCDANLTSTSEVSESRHESGHKQSETLDLIPEQCIVVSDAYVLFSDTIPKSEIEVSRQFLAHLAAIYRFLPKRDSIPADWVKTAAENLKDLINYKVLAAREIRTGTTHNGFSLLPPLADYLQWSAEKSRMAQDVKSRLLNLYGEQLQGLLIGYQTVENANGKQSSNQVSDFQDLNYARINLAQLALSGETTARRILLDTIDDSHKGQEIPESYTYLMVLVWQLTGDTLYLTQAEEMARKIKAAGNRVNVAFAACALLELYKATNRKSYVDFSYCCLSELFKTGDFWDCDQKSDAACTEPDVYAALTRYSKTAATLDIAPSAKLLAAEFVKHAVRQFSEQLHNQDINEGLAFGVVSLQYFKVKGERFMVFCDYPVLNFKSNNYKSTLFQIVGDNRAKCSVQIVSETRLKHADFVVSIGAGKQETIVSAIHFDDKHMEFSIPGDSHVKIKWK